MGMTIRRASGRAVDVVGSVIATAMANTSNSQSIRSGNVSNRTIRFKGAEPPPCGSASWAFVIVSGRTTAVIMIAMPGADIMRQRRAIGNA